MIGKFTDDRTKIKITVGYVECQHAVRFQFAKINGESFPGQQMDRDGVAAECVDEEDIELRRMVICALRPLDYHSGACSPSV